MSDRLDLDDIRQRYADYEEQSASGDGVPASTVFGLAAEVPRLLAEVDRLRAKNTELNGRAVKAEAACRTTIEDCRRQGVSMGRGLANVGYGIVARERDRLRDAITEHRDKLGDPTSIYDERLWSVLDGGGDPMTDVTDDDLRNIRNSHGTDYDSVGGCVCGATYPCTEVVLAEEVERLRALVAELEDGIRAHRVEIEGADALHPDQWTKATEQTDADLWALLGEDDR